MHFIYMKYTFLLNDLSFILHLSVQRRRVRKVLLHPQYEPSTLDSDVALLQLDSELVLTDHTQLICLPSLLQEDSLALDCQVTLGSIHGGKRQYTSTAVYLHYS